MKIERWVSYKGMETINAGVGGAVYLEMGEPAGETWHKITIETPDPPKPFETEIWVTGDGKICLATHDPLIYCKSCRKIRVREVQ